MEIINLSSSASAWKGKIEWSATQDTSENESTVYARIGTWKTDGFNSSSPSGGYFTGTLYVGDETAAIKFLQQNTAGKDSPQWLAELEVTIPHNADGSGEVYIYCEIDAPSGITMYGKPLKGGGTYPLASIPRGSSIGSANEMYFGDKAAVSWTPASESFYYKLKFSLGSWSYTTDAIRPRQTTEYTYDSYTIEKDVANQIPNSTHGSMTVSLYTYSDSGCTDQIGSKDSKTFKVNISPDMKPTITECNAIVSNTNSTVEGWGLAIAGFSSVAITADATGSYGSKITSFNISGGYHATKAGEALSYDGGVIQTSGNKEFLITCIDSRGIESSYVSRMVSFLPYVEPEVTDFSISKNENGSVTCTAKWDYDKITHDNTSYNSITAHVYYKQSISNSWTMYSTAIGSSGTITIPADKFEEDASYNFKVVVTDSLGKADSKSAFSSATQVLLDFRAGGKGLGIGKICESDGMEVAMDATFYNNVKLLKEDTTVLLEDYIESIANIAIEASKTSFVNSIYPIGSIYISMKPDNPKNILGVGAWEQLEGRFLLGAGSYSEDGTDYYYEGGSIGGENKHTLTVEEMPSHDHYGVARFDYDIKAGSHPSAKQTDSTTNLPRTNSTGGSNPHNNMPPYLVAYMWKRTG